MVFTLAAAQAALAVNPSVDDEVHLKLAPTHYVILKEQVKTLHYHLEELKATTQKHEADIAGQLARLESRMNTFEQEYVSKLQPTLLRVIEELEHIKGADVAPDNAADGPHEIPEEPASHASPVPELPEEELKF